MLYSLLFLCLLTPIIMISLPMKMLNVSSDTTRTGISDNIRVAASANNTWTNMTNPSGEMPSPRCDHSMVYDSAHDRVILFGGYNDTKRFDDTWVYNYTDNSWTNMTNPSGEMPSPRNSHSMVYDSAHDRVILFGGWDSGYNDETWVYNYTDNTWTNKTNPSVDKPISRSLHFMVYDSMNDRTILFGGYNGLISKTFDDTWVYNYADNSWTNVTVSMGAKPSPRDSFSMVYDSTNDRTILFGGYNDPISITFDDTWVYNYAKNSWTNVTINMGAKPISRDSLSMVYDSAHNRTILFGGYNFISDYYFCDTWLYYFAEISTNNGGNDNIDPLIIILAIVIPAGIGGTMIGLGFYFKKHPDKLKKFSKN